MADPLVSNSLLELLRRDAVHAQDLERALAELRERCAQEGIPFALLGALAMRFHGYVRFTEDIDILTTREGLDLIHERLVGRGLVPRAPGLRKGLRHAGYRVPIDVIQTGEHAGASDSPYVYPDPRSDAFEDREGLRIPTLATMITVKIVSGAWGHRHRDHSDAISLIQANTLAERFARRLPPEVRDKYLELLEQSRREKTLEE